MKIENTIGMRFYFSLYFLLLIPGLSCSDGSGENNRAENSIQIKAGTKDKPPSSFTDTVKIGSSAAVFFNPDQLQLERMKVEMDTMIFESTVHDCFYQMRNSRVVLKQYYPHIKIIEVKNARYLLFEKAGGEKEYIDLNTIHEPCGIFIFNRIRKAELADMTNIETQLGFYFSK